MRAVLTQGRVDVVVEVVVVVRGDALTYVRASDLECGEVRGLRRGMTVLLSRATGVVRGVRRWCEPMPTAAVS